MSIRRSFIAACILQTHPVSSRGFSAGECEAKQRHAGRAFRRRQEILTPLFAEWFDDQCENQFISAAMAPHCPLWVPPSADFVSEP